MVFLEISEDTLMILKNVPPTNAGYSVVRSLSEAPFYAAAIARALKPSDDRSIESNSQEAAIQGTILFTDYVWSFGR